MIRYYLAIGLRHLSRNGLFVLSNALGLGISLACCIAVYLWVAYDREFDDFHKDKKVENVYKLHTHWDAPTSGQNILSPFALGPMAADEIAGITKFTRYNFENGFVIGEQSGFEEGIGFADSAFFEMFDFPVLEGNLNVFKSAQHAVISLQLSNKMFGKQSAIGKQISLRLNNQDPIELIVAAVISDIPHNSSFTFDVMVRIEQYQKIKKIPSNDWSPWPAYSTFFEIKHQDNLSSINHQLQKYIEPSEGELSRSQLEHFKADFTMTEILGAMVNIRMWQTPIRILSIMAIVIFLIACFNLSNTSFALMSRRMKEIGIRKTLGANRLQIFTQFLIEIIITVLLSLIIGLVIAELIVPSFADMWATGIGNRWGTLKYRLDNVNGLNYLVTILLILFSGVSIAGIYPALVNSRFRPVMLLKGELKVRGTNLFNRSLLVFQFSASLLVLVFGIIFILNSNYMANRKVGFDKEQILYVKVDQETDVGLLTNVVNQIPGVVQTIASQDHIGMGFRENEVDVNQQVVKSRLYFVQEKYIQTMGIRLNNGRYPLASDHGKSVVVTEKFLRKSHIVYPIGQVISVNDIRYSIVGVVDDFVDDWFMLDSRNQMPQILLMASPGQTPNYLIVRCQAQQIDNVQAALVDEWNSLFPTKPFKGGQHLEEGPSKTAKNLKNIFIFLTFMTILLSCLGIYSLAALNVEKRMGEIGIRKVLGASVVQIIQILNREFTIILLLSGLIGSGLAYWLHQMITYSDYKIIFIEVSWTLYMVASVLLIAIGVLTSASIIAKGANQDPVNVLRKN